MTDLRSVVLNMPTLVLQEVQLALLPAALGTFAIVYSNIQCMMSMGSIRYAKSEEEKAKIHPYKPWDDKSDTAEPHFRAFKACQNVTEWTVYTIPTLFLYVLYVPAVPVLGSFRYRGVLALPWTGLLFALAIAHFNLKYVEGYTTSADARIPAFKRRTWLFRLLAYGSVVGMLSSLYTFAQTIY